MTAQEKAYIYRLKGLCDKIADIYDREVFNAICKRFVEYKLGESETKNISKTEIIDILVSKGLMSMAFNKDTGEYDKYPDDRRLRLSMRELLKQGYPIITTSHSDGCFIPETEDEVTGPQKENHARAVAILDVDKGYNKVKAFLRGEQ